MSTKYLPRDKFQSLIDALVQRGYAVCAPQVRDGAIVFEQWDSVASLPQGLVDVQQPGAYRLEQTGDQRWFRWANGPLALKAFVSPPRQTLWQAHEDGGLHFDPIEQNINPTAFIGVRGCDVAALALMDAHFLGDDYPDPYYERRRRELMVISVDCVRSANTCFCVSTGDGPDVKGGVDIALHELDDGFLCRAGSDLGRVILSQLDLQDADQDQVNTGHHEVAQCVAQQKNKHAVRDFHNRLRHHLDHSQWNSVAQRCLSCGNCTAVCPTCFCHREADETPLDGRVSEHYREWDSCFSQGHSYIHGITIRAETDQRYRQWLTHKLDYWHDQYGRSGCVGCGRCVTWCPVGIDLIAEASAICKQSVEDA